MGKSVSKKGPSHNKAPKQTKHTEGGLNKQLIIALVIALVGVYLVGFSGTKSSPVGASVDRVAKSASSTLRDKTSWLEAPTEADEGIEFTVLTQPTPLKSAHGYQIYPPQRGLTVLKQMGNGTFTLWRDANMIDPPSTVQITADTMKSFRTQLEPHLKLEWKPHPEKRLRHLKQKWQLFSATGSEFGQRLDTLKAVKESRLFVVMEGGQWIWPGVKVGHKQGVPGLEVQGKQVVLETLSLVPLVFSISGFLAHEECDLIIENGKDRVEASPVALMDKDKGKPATEWRTSSQAWLDPHLLPKQIKERTAAMLRVGIRHQEQSVQFLKYALGQKYDAHHDYFDMQFYSAQPQVVAGYDHGFKNRLSTVFWYLNEVEQGGETQFPRAGGMHQPRNFEKCQGMQVKPAKGRVILFYSLLPSGDYDSMSLHGGCPVKGDATTVKWAANQWTWNKPF